MTFREWLKTHPRCIRVAGHEWSVISAECDAESVELQLDRVERGKPYLEHPYAPLGPCGLPMSRVIEPETVHRIRFRARLSEDVTMFLPAT